MAWSTLVIWSTLERRWRVDVVYTNRRQSRERKWYIMWLYHRRNYSAYLGCSFVENLYFARIFWLTIYDNIYTFCLLIYWQYLYPLFMRNTFIIQNLLISLSQPCSTNNKPDDSIFCFFFTLGNQKWALILDHLRTKYINKRKYIIIAF